MQDAVTIDLRDYENRCERNDDRDALANKADTMNDDFYVSPEEQDRCIALVNAQRLLDYNAQVLACAAVWAVRCARPVNQSKAAAVIEREA